MNLLYTLGIHIYARGIRVASLFSPKARKWRQGRRNWRKKLVEAMDGKTGWTWFHCASLGEFEQGRPLIEALKAQEPDQPILLTFFSPSGYEIRKNYALADHVCYLPLDLPSNARAFLDTVQPRRAFFIKYDLWLHFLSALHQRSIPHYLVSSLLRPNSQFLRGPLKKLYRKAFSQFTWIFAQDQGTVDQLRAFTGLENASVAGDTRFDRAARLPESFTEVPGIAEFVGGRKCVVVGSSYAKEEEMLLAAMAELRKWDIAWIVAPHEIDKARIAAQVEVHGERMGRYSKIETLPERAEVLWIDNIGMLSRLYHYAEIAYVGGGFGKTVHNTQEPAAYGNPVIFGPVYQGFREAVDMVALGTAFSISDARGIVEVIDGLFAEPEHLAELREKNRAYMQKMAGATEKVLEKLGE